MKMELPLKYSSISLEFKLKNRLHVQHLDMCGVQRELFKNSSVFIDENLNVSSACVLGMASANHNSHLTQENLARGTPAVEIREHDLM